MRPKTSRQIFARAGFTYDMVCSGDTYFSIKDYFDLDEVLAASGKPRSTTFCLYFVHKHAETTITNTLSNGEISYASGYSIQQINRGASKSLTVDAQVLRMKLAVRNSPENLHFDFTNIQGGGDYQSFGQRSLAVSYTHLTLPTM